MDKARVLLAEDDVMVSADLAIEREASGLVVSGTTCSLAQTLKLIDERNPDIVLLNIGLRDGVSFPEARRLKLLDIPFVFLTSFEKAEIDPEFRDAPLLEKPQPPKAVAAFIAGIVETWARTPILRDGRDDRALS